VEKIYILTQQNKKAEYRSTVDRTLERLEFRKQQSVDSRRTKSEELTTKALQRNMVKHFTGQAKIGKHPPLLSPAPSAL